MKNQEIISENTFEKIRKKILELKEKNSEIERRRLMELSTICKVTILHKYVFRNSNPAIFSIVNLFDIS